MPMMRRGPLDRYPPEWVLRQANAHRVEGSIEFHSDRPVTLYLAEGRIYAAERGVSLAEADLAGRPVLPEQRAREKVVSILAEVLASSSGWYFHDPLGHHPRGGAATWETATLLMDTRAKAHESNSLAAWAGRSIVLQETPAASITLGPDAWAVVVQLAGTAKASELRAQMGWSPSRLAEALSEIESRGVLDATPVWKPPPPPPLSATPPPPASLTAPPGDVHHTGPLPPPPPIDDSAVRRRVLPLRRTTGS